MKRMIWAGKKVALVVLILVVGGYGAMEVLRSRLGEKEEEPEVVRPVRAEVLGHRDQGFKGIYQGTTQASRRVDLSFRVSGPLVEFPVRKGQQVKTGDLLAKVDPRDFKNHLDSANSQLKQLEAKLSEMKSGARAEDVSSAQAAVNAAQAQFSEAEANYKRFKSLMEQGAVSQVQYEQYRTAYNVARSSLQSAQGNLQKARSGARKEELQQQQAAIDAQKSVVEAAQSALSDTELKAPFDGVVADTFADNHQFVQAKQSILSLQDLSNIEMVVHVPDGDVVRMREKEVDNLTMTATLDSIPGRAFPVTMKEFSTQADPKTQTYQATVTMPYPEGLTVLPGMAVTLTVDVTPKALSDRSGTTVSEDFSVPSDAVFSDGAGQTYLWLFVDGLARKTPVTAGKLEGDIISVQGELSPGDVVITAGVHFLREGQKVRLMTDM
ncbi:MAG: efflux RND transporter periplasmic adaptor subunit [Dethiosulfovibrio sp.]|nr:efflux RND transporter periplasmic adaptor subunit [Dethiosulfovibrio sp.]